LCVDSVNLTPPGDRSDLILTRGHPEFNGAREIPSRTPVRAVSLSGPEFSTTPEMSHHRPNRTDMPLGARSQQSSVRPTGFEALRQERQSGRPGLALVCLAQWAA